MHIIFNSKTPLLGVDLTTNILLAQGVIGKNSRESFVFNS